MTEIIYLKLRRNADSAAAHKREISHWIKEILSRERDYMRQNHRIIGELKTSGLRLITEI